MKTYVEAEKLMQIAFVLPSAVVIGWLLGWWIGKLTHQPRIVIAGVIFGCVSGLYFVIQTAIASEKNARRTDKTDSNAGKGTPSQ